MLEHDVRPWGEYWVLEDAETHKVKRILAINTFVNKHKCNIAQK